MEHTNKIYTLFSISFIVRKRKAIWKGNMYNTFQFSLGFQVGASGEELVTNVGHKYCGFDAWVGKNP